MYRNPNPVCTKTLKWRQLNERNVTGSSITITFHSRWGKKTYLKAQKKFEISQTWFAVWTPVWIKFLRKSESVRFSHKFCSYFIGCGFVYRAKSWIQLRTNMYITILFSKVQAAALNPLSVFKTLLKAQRSPSFRRGWGKEKLFTRKVSLHGGIIMLFISITYFFKNESRLWNVEHFLCF